MSLRLARENANGFVLAVDVADIPVMIIVGHVEGGRSARGIDVATRGGFA